MEHKDKKCKRSHPFYAKSLAMFSKQYKDIQTLQRVYINDQNKVYAADRIDSKGVFNFIGGYAPDVAFQIDFID